MKPLSTLGIGNVLKTSLRGSKQLCDRSNPAFGLNNEVKDLLTYLPTNLLTSTNPPQPSLEKGGRKAAFTLAEVLITLGIIGIVAALTLPTVITKHQKKVTATRLKQTYSIISQAFASAQAEYGDTVTWDCMFKSNIASNEVNREEMLTNIAKKYLLPYIKSAKDYGYINAHNKFGYTGSTWTSYYFSLPNSTLVEVTATTGQNIYVDIALKIDINGFKGPNKGGRDIFTSILTRDGKYIMYSGYSQKRTDILKGCATNSTYVCGARIQMDGWEIKDDYPW